ncbi:Coiled-coil domain-containing protein 6, partial [Fasciola gigantica]
KKITELKKEKESLALNYEQEEECLTNELNRKFTQLRREKVALEQTLAREQEDQVTKLKMRIEKLETDMNNKQNCLDKLRREKIELENALEQEQEALVNRLWKKMEKLENEKRTLQEKLESLGALLSASSSNQSLASVPQLSTSGNGSIQRWACGICLRTFWSPASTSSGPGSLRGSLRHQHPQGPPTSLSMTPGLTSPGGAPVVPVQPQSPGQSPCRPLPPPPSVSNTGSGDPRTGYHSQHGQLNQSDRWSAIEKTSDSTNIAPPQSPMDVDSAGESSYNQHFISDQLFVV